MQIAPLPRGLALCVALLATPAVVAQERSLASLMPETVVAFLEVEPVDQLLDHPMRVKIQESPEFLAIWRSPGVLKMRGGITLAEIALGDKLENIARSLTSGGVAIAVDAKHEGVVLIARTEGKQWLEQYLQRLVTLARDDATNKNEDDPIKEVSYRGLAVYRAAEAVTTAVDEYLIVSNKAELGKNIVDRYLDKLPGGLEQAPSFQAATAARANKSDGQFAWGYADVASLRAAGLAKDLFAGRAENFAAELILGGILETLHKTPLLTATWAVHDNETSLTFSAPLDANTVSDERDFFFGPEGSGRALPLLTSDNTLASISSYRDVSLLWLRAGDLFGANVNDQLAQADNTLTTLFSGRDFGEDILGALQPELRIVVAQQRFDSGQPIPAIRLPGFALVAQLRDPELMRSELKRTFQSLIGFLNVSGAMNGQPQLDLGMESDGQVQLFTAQYVREVDRERETGAPIQYNFSPSLAFVGDQVILSSTIPLSKQLSQQLASEPSPSPSSQENTLLEINIEALKRVLEDNREQLIAQNMLEKGHSKQEAEAEVDSLLSIMRFFSNAKLQLGFKEQATLNISLQLAD